MTEPEQQTETKVAEAALAVPVWDLPVRIVHWSLVLLIAFSWWSAENEEIEWHVRSGLMVLFLLVFRILWGFFGSSTARFRSFVTGPRKVRDYLRDSDSWRGIGHTPLGALSVVALLALLSLQVSLGLPLSDEYGVVTGPLNRLVSFDTAEWAHEVHELLFNGLLALIALHVAAILFYRWKGKRLVRAMVTGRSSENAAGTPGMVAAGPVRLILCLALAMGVTWWISNGVPGL
ncbi:cytochrome b/b6 domain-containing protein [Sphingomonas sp. LHG3406-1]|uniref:cytochrome b/b6 domain-containing protein n=1 Tax=Sphingomonas sp. LHG3406-1 TaxID=2804617 RepID=UPI00262ED855|nr:cytochrome b/b6 domain-containing protein [Sphingomonas sp. LHG3406-1]